MVRLNIALKKIGKNIAALFLGLLISFIIAEIILHIYNPVSLRLKGNKIILPVNKKVLITNTRLKSLDTEILHTRNSIGFRGRDIPANFKVYLSIVTVGGSTTECYYLSDKKTWPAKLEDKLSREFNNIWVNNAGFDGHSTFGHQILIEDFLVKMKPSIILLLVGGNDVGRDDLGKGFDDAQLRDKSDIGNYFLEKSEVANLFLNLWRRYMAYKRDIGHYGMEFEQLINNPQYVVLDNDKIQMSLAKEKKFLDMYRIRLQRIVDTCRMNGIDLVLITQPMLYGVGKDDIINLDLEKVRTRNNQNGLLAWKRLELYNSVTREVSLKSKLLLIDLANSMPKSSKYFYDHVHFTNDGAEKVSDIIESQLRDYIIKKYPAHSSKDGRTSKNFLTLPPDLLKMS
jgi:lysophospholipase L1-like esterase